MQRKPSAPKQSITPARLEAAIDADDYRGFCLACGREAYGVEEDARKYECETCGALQVYGVGEIAIMLL